MIRPSCQVCEAEPEGECSGPNMSQRFFCLRHLNEHAESCPDVAAGRAKITWRCGGRIGLHEVLSDP
jgi:hypothetical protein